MWPRFLNVTGISVINAEGIYFGNTGHEGQAWAGTLEETLEPARDRVEIAETVRRIHDGGSGDVLLPYNGSPGALLVVGGMFGGVMAAVFVRSRRGRYAAAGNGLEAACSQFLLGWPQLRYRLASFILFLLTIRVILRIRGPGFPSSNRSLKTGLPRSSTSKPLRNRCPWKPAKTP